MALIPWSNQFSVAHPKIDEQHKELVEIVNRLHEAMINRQGKEALKKVFEDLSNYTRMHFRTEEDLMARHKYPEAVAHKKLHDDLVAQLMALHSDFERGKLSVTMDTMAFVKQWLLQHIGQVDKKLGAFLAGRL